MLESYNITLQAIRFIESIGKKTTIYRFIYDTKRKYQQFTGSDGKTKLGDPRPYKEKCQHDLLKDLLEEHVEGYEVAIELPNGIKSPPGVGWRVFARVHFTRILVLL
jgi:hypothetical protein